MANQNELMNRWNKRIQKIKKRVDKNPDDLIAEAEYRLLATCMEELGFMRYEETEQDKEDREFVRQVAASIRDSQEKIKL